MTRTGQNHFLGVAIAGLIGFALFACPKPPAPAPPPAPLARASLRFPENGSDRFGPLSYHTAPVCQLLQALITFSPPLKPGEQAHIEVDESGGATASLGNTGGSLKKIDQTVAADSALGFGFHMRSGRSGVHYVELVITIPGRPAARIRVVVQ